MIETVLLFSKILSKQKSVRDGSDFEEWCDGSGLAEHILM